MNVGYFMSEGPGYHHEIFDDLERGSGTASTRPVRGYRSSGISLSSTA